MNGVPIPTINEEEMEMQKVIDELYADYDDDDEDDDDEDDDDEDDDDDDGDDE